MPYNTEQNTANSRAWRQRAWNTLIAAMGGKCRSCGYVGDRRVYDMHHVDPASKTKTLSALIVQQCWQKVVDEARKCVLICCRCHREIHAGLRECPSLEAFDVPERLAFHEKAEHGTHSFYSTYKCRCDLCKAAQAEYMRKYRGGVA